LKKKKEMLRAKVMVKNKATKEMVETDNDEIVNKND
jgi:hypothetical protein